MMGTQFIFLKDLNILRNLQHLLKNSYKPTKTVSLIAPSHHLKQ